MDQMTSETEVSPSTLELGALLPLTRSVVLVGLMGAGKSAVGRRLAARLGVDFVDADAEIEASAGCSIEEIFNRDGEPAFRAAERRIVHRLLTTRTPLVLATGGGAFLDGETRAVIATHGISVWLRAELDVLVARTARRSNRPLLKKGDPRTILENLIAVRYPVYAEADVTVDSDDGPVENTVCRVVASLVELRQRTEWPGAAESTAE